MGKGSTPRPIPDPQKFRDNWDQIFGKKEIKQDITNNPEAIANMDYSEIVLRAYGFEPKKEEKK
jgi:hypothetical protein